MAIKQPLSRPHPTANMEILEEDYEFNCGGLHFIVKKGFTWDGASVPIFADRFVGHKFEPHNRRFSLGHDALFRAGITTREKANIWAVNLLKDRKKVHDFRRWATLRGLQLGSYFAWNNYRKKPKEWQMQYIEIIK